MLLQLHITSEKVKLHSYITIHLKITHLNLQVTKLSQLWNLPMGFSLHQSCRAHQGSWQGLACKPCPWLCKWSFEASQKF